MTQMSDYGTIPAGLPLGLTDSEKKLWRAYRGEVEAATRLSHITPSPVAHCLVCSCAVALYVKARELVNEAAEEVTVRNAVHDAIDALTVRTTLEWRFAQKWQKSLMTCLAMRQDYRSSDVYS